MAAKHEQVVSATKAQLTSEHQRVLEEERAQHMAVTEDHRSKMEQMEASAAAQVKTGVRDPRDEIKNQIPCFVSNISNRSFLAIAITL